MLRSLRNPLKSIWATSLLAVPSLLVVPNKGRKHLSKLLVPLAIVVTTVRSLTVKSASYVPRI